MNDKFGWLHSVKEGGRGDLRYRTKFLKRSPQSLLFKAYSKVKNPKVGSFLRDLEDFEGLRSQKNFIFQNAQIKV